MLRRTLQLAHEQPKLRATLVPLLRQAAYYRRRKEPKYTGFMGGKHDAAIAKGYLDAGLVDPGFVDQYPRKFLSAVLSNFPLHILLEKGAAFIRDPENNAEKAAGSESAFIAHLVKWLPIEAMSDFQEEAMYADEREDWQSSSSLHQVAKEVNNATVKVTPVRGRTGKGYKVTMRPTLPEIQAKFSR
jgi:hypothetical protein